VIGPKLLIAGVLMLVGALALSIFSDYWSPQLLIGGGVCAFLGVAGLLSRSGSGGAPVSADDLANARDLSRAERHYYD